MKEFKGVISIVYFLLGILLVSFVLPLLDGLTGLLLTLIEVAKGHFTVKVTEYNYQLKKLAYEEEDETPKRLIGFAREENEEDEDDNDDI